MGEGRLGPGARRRRGLALAAAVAAAAACSKQPPARLYDVKASAQPTSLATGARGAVTIAIETRGGAYVSDDAPLKVTLAPKNVTLSKDALGRADAQKAPGGPRFEVPFTAGAAGPASIAADVVFFLCTEKLCERQSEKIDLPLEVR